jgi:hypothetical protein
MCTTSDIIPILIGTGAAEVQRREAREDVKRQKSLADTAIRQQQDVFNQAQQRFEEAILPQVPEPEVIKTRAKDRALARRRLAASTILTSPIGIATEPEVSRKTLLGQ